MPLSWLQAAAATHEWLHGPLPDVVQTQGKHLVSRPTTPTYSRAPDPDFVEKLHASLYSLLNTQSWRVRQSGEDFADAWQTCHSSQEIKTNWTEDHTAVDTWADEFPPTPSDDDGSIQLSTISGRTLTIHKDSPAPEHTLPKLMGSKHGIGGCSDRLTSTLRSKHVRRMSHLQDTNTFQAAQSLMNTIRVEPSSTETMKNSRKRRLSDIENDSPTEPRRSKRRIAMPRMPSLVGVI